VATVAEALALLRANPDFDLAVLDVKISGPDGNSFGVAAQLAAKGTPFVFLTGMRVDDLHTKQFPQAPVVEKPYDAVALLDAVRRALKTS
jgi:CheY-like chemotaxis protein